MVAASRTRAAYRVNRIVIVAMALALGSAAPSAQTGAAPQVASATIATYCVSCHSGRTPAGRVSLDRHTDSPSSDPALWERVIRQLRARTMPPMTSPRPDHATYEAAISTLVNALDDGAGTTPRVSSDAALALRLARLIWKSEPDQTLRDAASKGELRDPRLLQAQVVRLLTDARSIAVVDGFFAPWLSLDSLATMQGDGALFPEFDAELRGAFRRETTLFVHSQLRENGQPSGLLTANYTFLNARLARHYGIPNVSGSEFRRVTWPTTARAGLLGQGSVLTLTSRPFVAYPVDVPTTSPAERAKWILTRFLGVNPPATVPGVPPIDFPFEKHTPLAKQSRTFPTTPCLTCHRSFFPLSYGLEPFDVLGRWRDRYERDELDATGTMVDGTTFNGPVELRRALLERQDAFLHSLTERLMAYAIDGTTAPLPTPAARMPAVRAALKEAATSNYSWSALIGAIAKASLE